jgi:hypothetical protein
MNDEMYWFFAFDLLEMPGLGIGQLSFFKEVFH